jgi:glycosyltransferase involved in cell wall biosynthesis
MRVAWDMQAVTGPKPTGLGIAAGMLQRAVDEHASDVEIVPLRPNLRNHPLKGVVDRLSWEQVRLPRAIAKAAESGADVFFSPALGVPLHCTVPKVAYVHDLIPLHFPQQFGSVAGWYWKELLPQSWRSCAALVVSNKVVAADLTRLLGYPRNRVFLAPYPLDPQFAEIADSSEAEAVSEEYFVCLGSIEPRKNIEQSIAALALLAREPRYAQLQLRIIGMGMQHAAALRTLAESLGVADRVVFLTDYVPKDEVVRQLRGARALLFMSRYEGFGLPPLEAISMGCPVILSDTPVHRAVYDDASRRVSGAPAPTFVRLDDAEALAVEMRRLLDDAGVRAKLAEAGRAYAATFTSSDTAQGLLAAFDAVAGR